MSFTVEQMQEQHVTAVVALEQDCRLSSRGESGYRKAIQDERSLLLVGLAEPAEVIALFSALMVVDENSLVLESNAMALRVFRPLESDPPLNFLLPLVHEAHADKVAAALVRAREQGSSEATELVLSSGLQGSFTGDLHIARIDNPMDELAHFICAFVDQGPLLAERQALRLSADELRRRNEELQQAQEQRSALEAQLRESHKMQAIGTMAGVLAVGTQVASAGLSGKCGNAAVVFDPPSVTVGSLESSDQFRVFAERQDVTLASPLAIDASAPGTYSHEADLVAGTIGSGTKVSSFMLHSDPVGTPPPLNVPTQ